MKMSRKVLGVLGGVVVGVAGIGLAINGATAHASTAPPVHEMAAWGLEDWNLGETKPDFEIQLGSPGQTVTVQKIVGYVTASPLPGANNTNGYVRQTLISIYDGNSNQLVGTVISSPQQSPQRWEQSLDAHLYDLNVKQIGDQAITMPVSITFPTPVRLPKGDLYAHFNNVTYTGTGTGISNDPLQSIDVEVHLEILFTTN